jgi:hypothetical protein
MARVNPFSKGDLSELTTVHLFFLHSSEDLTWFTGGGGGAGQNIKGEKDSGRLIHS